MPERKTVQKAREDARRGKSASTQAGEFVHEEMEHIREGKHSARNSKQAIAIGLSKARRAGVKLPVPRKGTTSARTRRKAKQDLAVGRGQRKQKATSRARSRATSGALKREGRSAASPRALSRHAKKAAASRRKRGSVTPRRRRQASGRARARVSS